VRGLDGILAIIPGCLNYESRVDLERDGFVISGGFALKWSNDCVVCKQIRLCRSVEGCGHAIYFLNLGTYMFSVCKGHWDMGFGTGQGVGEPLSYS
jgi:hypothetical protein